MNGARCACPECTCIVDADAVVVDGKAFCCSACAEGHPADNAQCRDPDCQCGEANAQDQPRETQVDHALEETFPASDPISP